MSHDPAQVKGAIVQAQLNELFYQMGRMHAHAEAIAENTHTCGRNERYPFPPVQDCNACRITVEKHVRRSHLETAYKLFGWDLILDSYIRAINLRIRDAQARRQMGAYI